MLNEQREESGHQVLWWIWERISPVKSIEEKMVAFRKELKCGCVQLLFPTTIRYEKICKKHEVTNGLPPTDKSVGIRPTTL
jgi:hypothetical protein